MFAIGGKLVDSKQNKFISHSVVVSFEEKDDIEDGNNSQPLWTNSQKTVPVSPEGVFLLEIPDKSQLRGSLSLDVVAPNGEHLINQQFPIENLKSRIIIEVDAKTFPELLKSDDPFLGRRVKLTGRVIDTKGRQVSNKEISLWGIPLLKEVDNGNQASELLLHTHSDRQGYFSGVYPKAKYSEAYGMVGGDSNEKIAIQLKKNLFPMRVVLVVDILEDEEKKEKVPCVCDQEIPRSPDTEDLINSPETFSADIGIGGCVDVTVPNRALEEFSFFTVARTTEPQIKGLTLGDPMKLPTGMIKLFNNNANLFSSNNPGTGRNQNLKFKTIDAGIMKSLLADPDRSTPQALMSAQRKTAYQKFNNVLDVVIKKTGGRSTLNSSNSIDWDDTPTFYQATSIAHGHILHMKQVWKADGYSLGDLLYSLPLAPCQKKQIAVVDWDRKEKAGRTELLEEEEQLQAMLSRDRDINEIVNTSLEESMTGSSVAYTEGDSVGGGAGVSGEGTIGLASIGVGGVFGFSSSEGMATSFASQNAARKASGQSLQKLRDTTMQSASFIRSQRSSVIQTVRQGETMRVQTEVVANHNHCHAITIEYFEVLRHFQVFQELADVQECLFVPLLLSRFDSEKALRWRETLRKVLRSRSLVRGFDAIERILNNYEGSDLPEGRYSEAPIEYLDGEIRISFHLVRPKDKEDGEKDDTGWNLYEPFLEHLNGSDSVFNLFFHDEPSQAERDKIWQSDVAPNIAEEFVQSLQFYIGGVNFEWEAKMDPTLVSSYSPNIPLLVSLRPKGVVPAASRESITKFIIAATYLIPLNSKIIVHSGSVRYRNKHMSHYLFRDWNVKNDLKVLDRVEIPTFPDREELRDPRKEDLELKNRLLSHLNQHIEYYHRMIWWRMDKDRRYMLLDGYIAPNSNGRSVASVVENRLIGIVGNCLVMPVSRGIKLDPTFRQDKEKPIDLLEHYAPSTPIPPMRISVPTRGVFAESIMGSCNSCEHKDDTRFWRFEESPCGDEPTQIVPVSTESRRAEPGDLKAKDFAAPVVAFQNVPPAPDPTGLAAAFNLLGTPNLFRDITGLSENQKNAIAALTANVDAVKFYTQKAAELAARKGVSSDLDKTMRSIKEAEKDGTITKDQANDLTMSTLGTVANKKEQPQKSVMDRPEVGQGIEDASKRGQGWSAEENGDKVEVKEKTGEDLNEVNLDLVSKNPPEKRSFYPTKNDKANSIELEAIGSKLPYGAKINWSASSPDAVNLSTDLSNRTTITGNRPGLTNLTAEVLGTDGKTVTADAVTSLCVPFFVEVIALDDIGVPSYYEFLAKYNLTNAMDQIIGIAKEVAELILTDLNARIVWNLSPLNEELPQPYKTIPDLSESHYLQLQFDGRDSEEITIPNNWNFNNYGEIVVINHSQGGLGKLGIWGKLLDSDKQELKIQMLGRTMGACVARSTALAAKYNLLHLNDVNQAYNIPDIPNDILNEKFSLKNTIGIEILDEANFPQDGSYEDKGLVGMAKITSNNKAVFDGVLPVPPEFQ